MSNTRDANLGAGVQSGLSSKEKIGGTKGVSPGRNQPEAIRGAWPKNSTQSASRGHKFKQ